MIADYGFLLELETGRGVQLNFFPLVGECYATKVSYMFKSNGYTPASMFLQIFCRTPGLRTVKRRTVPRESCLNQC